MSEELDLLSLPEWARLEIEAARNAGRALDIATKALKIERDINKKQRAIFEQELRYYEDKLAALTVEKK